MNRWQVIVKSCDPCTPGCSHWYDDPHEAARALGDRATAGGPWPADDADIDRAAEAALRRLRDEYGRDR